MSTTAYGSPGTPIFNTVAEAAPIGHSLSVGSLWSLKLPIVAHNCHPVSTLSAAVYSHQPFVDEPEQKLSSMWLTNSPCVLATLQPHGVMVPSAFCAMNTCLPIHNRTYPLPAGKSGPPTVLSVVPVVLREYELAAPNLPCKPLALRAGRC